MVNHIQMVPSSLSGECTQAPHSRMMGNPLYDAVLQITLPSPLQAPIHTGPQLALLNSHSPI